ncbi:MAG: TlpA disulfide reductase family protein [Planctomycetaceae bacterium]
MMHDNVYDEDKPRNPVPKILIVVGLAAVAFALFIRSRQPPPGADVLEPTVLKNIGPAPDLLVEGWINGEPPTPASMNDKVIVLEAFATWCGPCREFIPELAKLERKFSGRGVIFLSLTNEEGDMRSEIDAFAKELGMTWRIAYGADHVMRELEANYIPATYVISREGQIVWTNNSPGQLEEAIEKALEFKAVSDASSEATPDAPVETTVEP